MTAAEWRDCPLSDCMRVGEHALHRNAEGSVWYEPVIGEADGRALEHAHFFTFGEARLGRASKITETLIRHGLATPTLRNRDGVLKLTTLGHAVADLRARRRIRDCQAALARFAPQGANEGVLFEDAPLVLEPPDTGPAARRPRRRDAWADEQRARRKAES